jgi:non-ribosomal peptide synthetase component F
VFTSVLNHTIADQAFPLEIFGKQVFAISQTPQVWLDNQVMEINGALQLSWDIVEGLFAPGQAESMFAAYTSLLVRLSEQPHTWTEHKPIEKLDEDCDRVEIHEYRSEPLRTAQRSISNGRASNDKSGDEGEFTQENPLRDRELERRITDLICERLDLGELDPDTHLLEQGASSMQVVMLADHLERELGHRPQIEMLFAFPTAGTLVSELGKTLGRKVRA